MATKLTQAKVDKTRHDHEPGVQIYDADVSGLRIVAGKKSASYKLMGRIDELSFKSARERAKELRMILRRGDDPRAPKGAIPNLNEVFERYMNTRGKELSPRTRDWYRQKVEGSLSSLKKLPVDRTDRATVRALHEKITRKSGGYGANGPM